MVHFANRAAAELFVISGEQLRPLSEVVREKLGMLIIKGNGVQPDGSCLVCELCRGGEEFTGEMMVEETEWAGELAYLVSVRDITELREAQKALRESEERFRASFEQGVVGICYCDAEGKILWVNQKFCQICGYEEEELRRTTFADLCSTTSPPGLTSEQSPEEERSSAPQFRKNSAGEIVESTVEKQCLRKDGSLVWVEMSLSVVREATFTGSPDLENRELGEIKYLVAIVTDISSRKQAEEQLRYRLALETAVAEISWALVTSSGNVDFPEILGWLARAVGANRACLVKFQLETGSTVPASSRRAGAISSIRRAHIDCWHDGEKTSGKNIPATSHMEKIFRALELADLPETDLMAKFQRSDTAEVSLPLAVADVAALPEQNKKVKRLLQSLNVASLLLVPIAAPQSGQGHKIWGFLCIETTNTPRETGRKGGVAEGGGVGGGGERLLSPLPTLPTLPTPPSPLPRVSFPGTGGRRNWSEEDTRVVRIVGEMIYTWWAQRQASASLQASEALYAGIFNHSAESIFLLDVLPDGKLVWETANAAWEKGMGIPAAAIALKSLWEVLPSSMAASLENRCRACIAGGGPIIYEQTLELRGSTRMWRVILVPIWDAGGRIVKLQGSARDVTEEKRAIAEQLRQTRYRHLLTSIVLKIRSSLDIENILSTTVLEVQKTLQAERVFFYLLSPDGSGKLVHLVGTPDLSPIPVSDAEGSWLPEDIEKYCCSGAYAIAEITLAEFSQPHLEFLHRHGVRSQMTVPVFVRPLSQEVEEEPGILLWGLLCVQQCHQRRDWTVWEVDLMKELADQLSIALYQGQLLEQETRQRQELARSNGELEQFAYIASHDLQEPLRTVGSFAQLLERRYQDKLEEKALRYIKFIVDGTNRMQTLVNDLLEYSRVGTRGKPFQVTDCNAVLEEAIANLEGTIRKTDATVQGWRYGDSDITGGHYRRPKAISGLPVVMADSGQLVQLFQNLIGNAIKYSRPDEPPLVNVKAVRQEDGWQFCIQDNGIGIDPKHFDRIFQIFQRLHAQDEYSGTGIGLAICQKIILRHGGRIWVESKSGFGSWFYFTIPDRNVSTP